MCRDRAVARLSARHQAMTASRSRSLPLGRPAVPQIIVILVFAVTLAVAGLLIDGAVARAEFQAAQGDVEQAIVELDSRSPSMGALAPIDEIDRRVDAQRPGYGDAMIYAVRRSDGRMIAGNVAQWPANPPGPSISEFQLAPSGAVAVGTVRRFGNDFEMLVARRMITLAGVRGTLIAVFGLALALSLIAASAVYLRTWRRNQRIVAGIAQDLSDAASGAFRKRIAEPDDPMLAEIVQRVNMLLAKVESSTDAMRQLAANIAHELAHPLAGAIEHCERMVQGPESPSESSTYVLERLEAMDETFRGLLTLAEIETGLDQGGVFEPVDLAEVADEACELYADYAGEMSVKLVRDLASSRIFGSAGLVRSALGNLLSNAIRFSPDGGRILVATWSDGERCCVMVSDEGPGLGGRNPAELFQHLRTGKRDEGHRHGLGLRLVQAILVRHSARLEFEELRPGLGVKMVFACYDL